jgi:hypothetical protein
MKLRSLCLAFTATMLLLQSPFAAADDKKKKKEKSTQELQTSGMQKGKGEGSGQSVGNGSPKGVTESDTEQ